MSQENTITLRGFVTAEPKFWQKTPSHTPVTEIRVGSTHRRLNRATGEWEDGDTSYYNVKCWRRLAVNVKSSLRKGDMVIIRGKFFTRTWVDDQQRTRTQLQVEADSVGHDLAFGWSHFNRGAYTSLNAVQAQVGGEVSRQDLGPNPDGPDGADDTDELDALREAEMSEAEMSDSGLDDPGEGDPGEGDPGEGDTGMDGPAARDTGMSDTDFEKLAATLEPQAEIASTY